MYADTSPSSVSMIGRAVSEPPVFGDLGELVAGVLGQVVLLGVFLVQRADVDHRPCCPRAVDAPVVGDLGVVGVLGHDDPALGQLGRAFEQARVGIEDVAGIRLAAGRAPHQQRQLAVGGGLLGQVVVDAQGVAALLVHEVLGHGAAGVGGDVLQRGRVGGRRRRRRWCNPSRRAPRRISTTPATVDSFWPMAT